MSANKNQKSSEAVLAAKLAAGVQKHFTGTTPILIGGSTLTPAQVTAQLDQLATLRSDVDAARTVLKKKLDDEKKEVPMLRPFYVSVIAFVRAAYEGSPEVLADFGLTPKKVRKALSSEQLAAAAAKRASTRAARGTIGKKKKAAIKGNVTGVVVTPITAPSAPEPSATNAPSASNGAGSASGVVNGTAIHGPAAAH